MISTLSIQSIIKISSNIWQSLSFSLFCFVWFLLFFHCLIYAEYEIFVFFYCICPDGYSTMTSVRPNWIWHLVLMKRLLEHHDLLNWYHMVTRSLSLKITKSSLLSFIIFHTITQSQYYTFSSILSEYNFSFVGFLIECLFIFIESIRPVNDGVPLDKRNYRTIELLCRRLIWNYSSITVGDLFRCWIGTSNLRSS